MTSYFDSHLHLDFAAFDQDRAEVLKRASDLGVSKMVVLGCSREQWTRLSSLQEQNFEVLSTTAAPDIRVGVGLHPYWSNDASFEKQSGIETLLFDLQEKVVQLRAVCVGEMGVDKNKGAPLQKQIELFEAQLVLARDLSLPVVMHQVGHRQEFLAVIRRVGLSKAGGVVHGFSGDATWAKTLVKEGLFLGVGAGIVHPARVRLRQAVAHIPLEHLLIETDAPDARFAVGPDAPTGVRSEPGDVVLVAQTLAQIHGVDVPLVAQITWDTASRLFQF